MKQSKLTPEERLEQYKEIPSDYVYVHKNDLKRLENGEAAFVFIEIEGDPKDYEIVNSKIFQPSIKIDKNKYEVVYIMK